MLIWSACYFFGHWHIYILTASAWLPAEENLSLTHTNTFLILFLSLKGLEAAVCYSRLPNPEAKL